MAVYRKNFLTRMRSLKKKIGEEKDRGAAKMYLQIEKVVLDCDYSKYQKAKQLVRYSLDGNSADQCATYLNTSSSNIRDRLRLISDSLYNIFGEDLFDLFSNFSLNEEEIKKRVYVANHFKNSSTDYLFMDFLHIILRNTVPERKSYSVYDCKQELDFILRHSIPYVKSELSTLDKGKVAFLVDVLDGKRGNLDERFNFIKSLEAKEEVDEDVFDSL